ncbi:hypothetical protein C0Q70_11015 [Pomacea canaliculata]|uniref:Uncharacterized protein n=1 Tax=Pomacea canaliculata TaxID=400727 RepID=A0A2T7P4T7_POMCA|nr:hypothetical protein C0Q70_11015 [Pomacea canaliculata]
MSVKISRQTCHQMIRYSTFLTTSFDLTNSNGHVVGTNISTAYLSPTGMSDHLPAAVVCRFPHMRMEDLRYGSFDLDPGTWTTLWLPLSMPSRLAADGYFYNTEERKVLCFSCGETAGSHSSTCSRHVHDVPFHRCAQVRASEQAAARDLIDLLRSPQLRLRPHVHLVVQDDDPSAGDQQVHRPNQLDKEDSIAGNCRTVSGSKQFKGDTFQEDGQGTQSRQVLIADGHDRRPHSFLGADFEGIALMKCFVFLQSLGVD